MSWIKRSLLLLCLLIIFPVTSVLAARSFIIKKIRVQGLQRVSLGTVLSYLPVKEGDQLDLSQTSSIINALYKTNFFSDIQLTRQGNDLIITVKERPTIGDIHISGNKDIPKKKLLSALKDLGLVEGRVFDQSVLNDVKQALLEQYYSRGKYNAKVNTTISNESRNRVSISIDVSEGVAAKIIKVEVIGNKAFDERHLLRQFKLSPTKLWSFITHNDQYSREKLEADLESLRSFYLDRGYLKISIDSSQVSITPDRKHVYIVVHITEGPVYTINSFKLAGDFVGYKKEISDFITIKPGDTFSRAAIVKIDENIGKYLANKGYAFATVKVNPELDDENKRVSLTFDVQPGRQVYVRRVNFLGNNKTADYVLRREMRQMEGGVYSLSEVEESKRKLALLGYLEEPEVKTTPVPGKPDQVDLDYKIKETSSARASIQAGYSDLEKFIFGAELEEQNLMGTGKSVSLNFSRSAFIKYYSFDYFNPYYTMDGISRDINFYSQRTTPGEVNLTSSYTTDGYGTSMTYGMPISENSHVNFGFGYDNVLLNVSDGAATQVTDFVNEFGRRFDQIVLTGGWSYTGYDRAIFPTKGLMQAFSTDVGVPIINNSLGYVKLNSNTAFYFPLTEKFITHLSGDLGYGTGYGKSSQLPFFRNYYAGGIDSVRGYLGNSLGPKDSNGYPFGGNILIDGSVGLIFPNPIGESVRTTVFVDAGNVFDKQIQLDELRYSAGLSIEWHSPLGPLQFSLAKAINPQQDDETEFFQFSIGTSL